MLCSKALTVLINPRHRPTNIRPLANFFDCFNPAINSSMIITHCLSYNFTK